MKQDLPLVFAVILNWNKSQQTLTCISALMYQNYKNLHIIVVDNGSSDDSMMCLQNSPSSVSLIKNELNLGFAGGVNVGINYALSGGADYIWLVNNDAIPETDALSRLVTTMESDARIGLASPMILNADAEDEVEFCGGLWNENVFQTTNDALTYSRWDRAFPDRIWLVGTAMMISRLTVETIGLFNEKLFAYWEDNDYSVRSLHAGFRNVVVVSSVVRHWSGRPKTDLSSKPAYYHYYMCRNEILFIFQNLSFTRRPKPLIWALERQLRKVICSKQSPEIIEPMLIGLWDGVRGLGGAYQAERRLSPAIVTLLQKIARLYFRWREIQQFR